MKIKLRVKFENQDAIHVLEGESAFVIGRKNASLTLADKKCSSVHALLFQDPSQALCVKDSNSSNGTFLNGKAIKEHELAVGDVLQIGDTRITVEAIELGSYNTMTSTGDEITKFSKIKKAG